MIQHLVIRFSTADFSCIISFLKEEKGLIFFNGILRKDTLYLYSRNEYFDAPGEYTGDETRFRDVPCYLYHGSGVEYETALLEPESGVQWFIDKEKCLMDKSEIYAGDKGGLFHDGLLKKIAGASSLIASLDSQPLFHASRTDRGNTFRFTVSMPGGFLAASGPRVIPPGITDSRNRRTSLLLGEDGMEKLRDRSFGCIGAGGLMNHFITGAMHLGIQRFLITDGDLLEESNLNRFLGGKTGDTGKLKVEVMREKMTAFDNGLQIETVAEYFPSQDSISMLDAADILVCGIDNVRDRHLAQVYALATHRPLLDMGCGIFLKGDGEIDEWGGQVRLSLPGEPCLSCMGLAPAHGCGEGEGAGYVAGEGHTPASIVTLNAMVASGGLSLLLRYLLLDPLEFSHFKYDELGMNIFHIAERRKENCILCGDY